MMMVMMICPRCGPLFRRASDEAMHRRLAAWAPTGPGDPDGVQLSQAKAQLPHHTPDLKWYIPLCSDGFMQILAIV